MTNIHRATDRKRKRVSVRFNISAGGSARIIAHRRTRRYHEQLAETPHWNAPLSCVQEDDQDYWTIIADLEEKLQHEDHKTARTLLADGKSWTSREDPQNYLDEHEDELRLEHVDSLFTRGECTRCGDTVPVFGYYSAYAPAGILVCGACMTDDESEPAGPAILHM